MHFAAGAVQPGTSDDASGQIRRGHARPGVQTDYAIDG